MFEIKYNEKLNCFSVIGSENFYHGFNKHTIEVYDSFSNKLDLKSFYVEILNDKEFNIHIKNIEVYSVLITLIFEGGHEVTKICEANIVDEITKPVTGYSLPIEEKYSLTINRSKTSLIFKAISDCEISFDLEFYRPCNYPDFPYKEKFDNIVDLKAGETHIIDLSKDEIIKVYHKILSSYEDYSTSVFDSKPSLYFSSVSSIKEAIENLGLSSNVTDEEKISKLIAEKSMFIFEKFGLTEEILESKTIYAILKNLCNLLCVAKLKSLGFASSITSSGITLGKFEISDSGGGNSTGGDINSEIEFEEESLMMALEKYKVGIVIEKKFFNRGGCR